MAMLVLEPPAQYHHSYAGQVIERVLPLDQARQACARVGLSSDACSWTATHNPSRRTGARSELLPPPRTRPLQRVGPSLAVTDGARQKGVGTPEPLTSVARSPQFR